MMQQIANFIVDHDPMMVIRRTHDTVRYIRWVWNKDIMPTPSTQRSFACFSAMNTTVI